MGKGTDFDRIVKYADQISVDPISGITGTTVQDVLEELVENSATGWQFSASRGTSTSLTQDLRSHDGIPTNITPYIIPQDCVLYAVTAAQEKAGGGDTWILQVLQNDILVATMGLAATTLKVDNTLSVSFSKGDKVRIRVVIVSGKANKPLASTFFKVV